MAGDVIYLGMSVCLIRCPYKYFKLLEVLIFVVSLGSGVVDGLMEVLWGILDSEQPDTKTINNIVIPSVELIYGYAECLALHGNSVCGQSVAPAVGMLKKLLFSPYEAVRTYSRLSSSLWTWPCFVLH